MAAPLPRLRPSSKTGIPGAAALAIWLEPRHSCAPCAVAMPSPANLISSLKKSGFVSCKSLSNAPLC